MEASLVSGINVFAFDNLKDVLSFLENTSKYNIRLDDYKENHKIAREYLLDFKDVQG